MASEQRAADDYGSLVAALSEGKSKLSKRLQQVAQFFLNNPEDVAIYTIVEIARQAGTHPSTISRFAKEMGFDGFSGLQNVFRQRLVGPKMTYSDRMKALSEGPGKPLSADLELDDPHVVFDTFVLAAMDALLRVREDIDAATLRGFVEVLRQCGAVHIAAARGAFGVGTYSYYGFSRVGKRAHLIDNMGAMREQQLAAMAPDDALFVLTFDDYTPETVELAKAAHRKGRKLLVITDNELSPVAKLGTHTLYVKEARLGHFRSQVPAMVLCQSIIVSLGSLIDR
ncbi:MurR/RpiR family transcriptional regulator [Mesorhizobium sp.]|uniref:MurR/RpiR family transcriptional regulator n=1 Tax=Mesorhizobium sp. TaxID=1871066 RepID=UPI003BA9D27A